MTTIEKQIRDIPQRGSKPYNQVHAHSTGNSGSTAQNEADYMSRKNLASGYFTHVVGNGRIIQTAYTNRGAWDVGNKFNNETYAAVELIESHKTRAEFERDYKIYIELLRSLAKEAGLPVNLDSSSNQGIKTHKWCTDTANTYGGHVDPYPYLAKWGISKAQFQADIANGLSTQNGWFKSSNYWFFYENGVPFKNGWKKINNKWYLFDGNGAMFENTWAKRDGKWYYMDKSGAMSTGWNIINGKYYFLDSSGAMKEGWYKEGNNWYYLESSGAMKTGWFKDNGGNWYYLTKPSGVMVTGTVPIDGKTYNFNSSGVCLNP